MAITAEEADRELEEANERFAKAFKASDLPTLLNFYTPDCMIRGDRMETFHGHDGVKDHVARARKERDAVKVVMETETFWESHVLSDTAAIHCCSWKVYGADGNYKFVVLDMALWKRVNGEWKIYRGGWTS